MTPQEQQLIRQRTNWPDDIIRYIGSMEEAEIYMHAKLQARLIGGRWALCRKDINWADYSIRRNTWLKTSTQKPLKDYDHWAMYNNADLIGEGFPPRDPNGDPYELHHIGQQQDSPFAELTWAEHMGDGNNTILHKIGEESVIDRLQFSHEKSNYWQDRYKAFTAEEIKQIYDK
jgi:hypothetical protein